MQVSFLISSQVNAKTIHKPIVNGIEVMLEINRMAINKTRQVYRKAPVKSLNYCATCGLCELDNGKITLRHLKRYVIGSCSTWNRNLIKLVSCGMAERVESINRGHWRLTSLGWAVRNEYIKQFEIAYKRISATYAENDRKRKLL